MTATSGGNVLMKKDLEAEQVDTNFTKEICFKTHKMEEEMSPGGGNLSVVKASNDGRAEFAKHLMGQSLKLMAKIFKDSEHFIPDNISTVTCLQNASRNRYPKMLCNDNTRVILKNGRFLHANWVPIPNSMQRFICAQAPLEGTAIDFWEMILQEKCIAIVMLCDFVENNDEKCFAYFPKKLGASVDIQHIKISNISQPESAIDSVKWSILEVTSGSRTVQVNSFHYISWPDHQAPLNPGIVVDLLQLSKAKSCVRPIVVHCSAGIGRTGTFVGLEYANERLKSLGNIGLMDIVKELRYHRLQAVQTSVQYLYLSVSLLEYFARQNLIPRDSKFQLFLDKYQSYVQKIAAKHRADAK